MISRRRQLVNFDMSLNKAGEALHKFQKTKDPEKLHRLRVEVKKMKALLLVSAGSLNDDLLPETFEPVRKVFKKAGKIRSAVLHLELLKEEKINDKKLEKALRKSAEKDGKKFRKNSKDNFQAFSTQNALLKHHFTAVSGKHLQQLYEKELHSLGKLSHKRTGDPGLHECRKKIKYLLYIAEILDGPWVKSTKLNKFYLKKLEESLGEWHDVVDLVDLMKKEKYKPEEIPRRLFHLKSERREKVHELFKDFRSVSTVS
jgi:CHAD domain-containing protein